MIKMAGKLQIAVDNARKSAKDRDQPFAIFKFNESTKDFGFSCRDLTSKDDPPILCWVYPDGEVLLEQGTIPEFPPEFEQYLRFVQLGL